MGRLRLDAVVVAPGVIGVAAIIMVGVAVTPLVYTCWGCWGCCWGSWGWGVETTGAGDGIGRLETGAGEAGIGGGVGATGLIA